MFNPLLFCRGATRCALQKMRGLLRRFGESLLGMTKVLGTHGGRGEGCFAPTGNGREGSYLNPLGFCAHRCHCEEPRRGDAAIPLGIRRLPRPMPNIPWRYIPPVSLRGAPKGRRGNPLRNQGITSSLHKALLRYAVERIASSLRGLAPRNDNRAYKHSLPP